MAIKHKSHMSKLNKKLPPMRLTYSFQRDGGVTDVELFVDTEWLRIVAHRAVGNTRRRSKYAFASARVIGRRRYKNSNQSLELDVALIIQAFNEIHGADLETFRRIYADVANRKNILYCLARETPAGFDFPTFQQKTIERAIDILLLGTPEKIEAYLKLAEEVEYE